MDTPIGIGLLGCGSVANIHAEAIRRVPSLKLTSACSRSETSARRAGEAWGVPWYTDIEEFFSDGPLEAVAVCTPSGTHSDLGCTAALMGRHVLMEKPIDVSLEKADALIEACRRADVRLGVSFQSRFLDAPRLMKQLVEGGRLGRLLMVGAHIKWYRTDQYYAAAPWRGTLDLDGGGALINQAIHTVDLLRFIAGPVEEVSGLTGTLLHSQIQGEDTAVATLKMRNGALGVIEAATSAYPGFKRRLEVSGTEGTIVLEGDNIAVWSLRDGSSNPLAAAGEVSNGSADPMAIDCEGHRRVMEDFAEAIRGHRAPFVDGAAGRQSLEIVRAVYRSAREGVPVRL